MVFEKVSCVDVYKVGLDTAAHVSRRPAPFPARHLLSWHPEKGPPLLLPLLHVMSPGVPSVLGNIHVFYLLAEASSLNLVAAII